MHELGHIKENISILTSGWTEHIEYKERVTVHHKECSLRNGPRRQGGGWCPCPTVVEKRAKAVRHAALLAQLQNATAAVPVAPGDCERGSPNKRGSRPPGNMPALTLLDDITRQARLMHDVLRVEAGHTTTLVPRPLPLVLSNMLPHLVALEHGKPGLVREVRDASRKWVRDCRVMLGYEQPVKRLASVSCGACGGTLTVAGDASTDVKCLADGEDPGCRTVYARRDWVALMAQAG